MRLYIALLGKTLLDVSTETPKPAAEPHKPAPGHTDSFGFSSKPRYRRGSFPLDEGGF